MNDAEPNPQYTFDPPVRPSLAVQGSAARFPVRRIFCVGRNYEAHVREMGNDPDRAPPFFFTKPADAAFDAGPEAKAKIAYPPETADLHHEIELVVALGKGGRNIEPSNAPDHVFGYAVGIDLTRRDLQANAKKNGRPWDWAKGFDLSAPVSPIVPVAGAAHPFDPTKGAIRLWVDGDTRQEGDLAEQIWPVADIIAAISRSMVLQPGDLIMTGTPAGVGALVPGQTARGSIDGLVDVELEIDASVS